MANCKAEGPCGRRPISTLARAIGRFEGSINVHLSRVEREHEPSSFALLSLGCDRRVCDGLSLKMGTQFSILPGDEREKNVREEGNSRGEMETRAPSTTTVNRLQGEEPAAATQSEIKVILGRESVRQPGGHA